MRAAFFADVRKKSLHRDTCLIYRLVLNRQHAFEKLTDNMLEKINGEKLP